MFVHLFLKMYLFILFLTMEGLRYCTPAFSSCYERGLLFVVHRLLTAAVASLLAEHRRSGAHALQQLLLADSVVVAHGL